MTETTPTDPSLSPYGATTPEFRPAPTGTPPGSTASKVWGVILLILGLIGMVGILGSAAMVFGGLSASSFTFGVPEDVAKEMAANNDLMIADMKGRWTFWVNMSGEVVIVLLSFCAGLYLLIKPRPIGRKLALARAVLVLVLLPLYGYEQMQAMDSTMDSQLRISTQQIKQQSNAPGGNAEQQAEARRQAEEISGVMQKVMKGVSYGAVIFTGIGILVFNGLLFFFMSRPSVRDYLASVAAEGPQVIPGYDPSMGMIHQGPPPGPPPAS